MTSINTKKGPYDLANSFVLAVIKNDVHQIGELSGVNAESVFGRVIIEAIRLDNQKYARNPKDYRWGLGKCSQANVDRMCDMNVDLYIPDDGKIAEKVRKYMGDTIGSDGTLQMADPPLMSEEEAKAKAKKDTPPLHYRVPLMAEKKGQEWFITAPSEEYTAIMDVINKGSWLISNEKYQIK